MSLNLARGGLLVSIAENAIATPFVQDAQKISGCIYDASGNLIPLSQRVSGVGGDRVHNADASILSGMEPTSSIAEEVVYLGHLMGHYGHFLLESISTFWALSYFPNRRVAFHPFIFGATMRPFMKPFFEAFELDEANAIILREPTRFSRVIIPERTFHLNESVHERFGDLPRIVAAYMQEKRGAKNDGEHLFLSRAKLPMVPRDAKNQEEVDSCMRELGFRIIHPQEVAIDEQIPLYTGSKVIAGFAGSALHNALFAPPRTMVIEIGDLRSPTQPLPAQALCNMAGDLDARHISYRAKSISAPDELDISYLRERIMHEINL